MRVGVLIATRGVVIQSAPRVSTEVLPAIRGQEAT
jgi:hypothetical protein